MGRARRVALAICVIVFAGSGRAEEADLCGSLKAAWTAAKADPASIKTVTFPGATRCSFSDSDLRCFWHFADHAEASRRYDAFRELATACFAPLGLSPVHKVLSGVDTTALEPSSEADPNVDLFLPPDGAVVGISIVTSQ